MIAFIVGLLILGLIVGLFTREKGDGLLDTIGSGCGTIVGLVILVVIIIIVILALG